MNKGKKQDIRLESKIQKYKQKVEKTHTKNYTQAPAFLRKKLSVDQFSVNGFPCYKLKRNGTFPNIAVFYIYGGSLCYPIDDTEWEFLQDLVFLTEAEFIVPMYPLAPEYGCEEVFDMLLPAYNEASKDAHYDDIILMGGGTGAGIALSIMLQIWKEGFKSPTKLIMLSPILDAEFNNPIIGRRIREEKLDTGVLYGKEKKEFLKRFWIRNYEGRTEFTSPISEDLTDLCDQIFVASGTNDIYNLYARLFSEKINSSGNRVMFFEYTDAKHDFYLDAGLRETKHLKKLLHDVILGTDTAMIHNYMNEIRSRAELSKWFPDIFTDDKAVKYSSANKWTSRSMKHRNMAGLVEAAEQKCFDEAVRIFLMEYPDGAVVHLGCGLDTMFERVDNGRVNWYNLDSPGIMSIRALYTGMKEREHWVERSVNDFSWIQEINCAIDKGVLFVCHDLFEYMTDKEVSRLLRKIYKNFQGADLIFDISSKDSVIMDKLRGRNKKSAYRKTRFSMDDPKHDIEMLNPAYSVVQVKSVLDGITSKSDWNTGLKLRFKIDYFRQSHRMVHIRLGYEKYKTYDDKDSHLKKKTYIH